MPATSNAPPKWRPSSPSSAREVLAERTESSDGEPDRQQGTEDEL